MPWIDWVVVVVYLLLVVAAGLWMGRSQKTMEDYFLGGRSIPWGAALMSMVATEISAATFLGAPEQGYTRDLTYLQFGIGSIAARFILAFVFIGVFYRMRLFTVYGFLARRIGVPTKNCSAAMFLLGRFFAGGSRIFIASLAVKVVTGMGLSQSIVILGAISILYTLFGGIKAVIWTDVIQSVVLIGGALLSVVILLGDIPLSFSELISYLDEHDKFRLFNTEWRDATGGLSLFSNPFHMVPAILGGLFLTMATHGTDQAMIQRLLTCKDDRRGKRSMILSGFLGIGVTIVFLFIGMLLFAYVAHIDANHNLAIIARDLKASGQNGNFYLYYIIHRIPAGLTGLMIAAVIASAMSSIDSELNAMSATFVNDFYLPYGRKGIDPMIISRWATVVCGLLMIGVGVIIADFYRRNPETDLLSIALGVMTFFYGGLLGIFLVGLLTRHRGNNRSSVAGLIASVLVIVFISYKTSLIPGLAIDVQGDGFWSWLFHFQLGWPWFIVLGTLVSAAVALAGRTLLSVD